MTFQFAIRTTLAALALAAVSGVAFAMWAENGPQILMALAETGLAWCF